MASKAPMDDGGESAAGGAAADDTTVAVVGPKEWERLRDAARDALRFAYAPYSGFPVGAAALATDGRLITGANVENAAYGVTLCAECSLVSALMMSGGGRLAAFTCVNGDGELIMPCGRCRQLLWEHGGPSLLVDTPAGVLGMDRVLPQAFGLADLERQSSERRVPSTGMEHQGAEQEGSESQGRPARGEDQT